MAQWRDERLREALPLQLTGLGTKFGTTPHGIAWLNYARELLRQHLSVPPPATAALGDALDAALYKRQDLVERKRRQLVEFMGNSPSPLKLPGGRF